MKIYVPLNIYTSSSDLKFQCRKPLPPSTPPSDFSLDLRTAQQEADSYKYIDGCSSELTKDVLIIITVLSCDELRQIAALYV